MASLSERVRDNRLETSFEGKLTIHHYDDSDEEERRSDQRSECWEETQLLGRGGFGEVLLQRCVEGKRIAELCAVKRIERSISRRHGAKEFDFAAELEAIARFSHRRVSP